MLKRILNNISGRIQTSIGLFSIEGSDVFL